MCFILFFKKGKQKIIPKVWEWKLSNSLETGKTKAEPAK